MFNNGNKTPGTETRTVGSRLTNTFVRECADLEGGGGGEGAHDEVALFWMSQWAACPPACTM